MEKNQNLTLSLELIYLMGWLMKNKQKELRSLVEMAMEEVLANQLEDISPLDQTTMAEQLHETLLDFLIFLEDALNESLEPEELLEGEDDLIPTVDKIDAQTLDAQTLWMSIHQAKKQLIERKKAEKASGKPVKNQPAAKTALLKVLLENWQPNKQDPVN